MCKLEKTNDLCSTLKQTKNNKIRKCIYLLYLIFWLKLFIHQNFEIEFFHNKVTTSLFESFKQKEIFFNVTLIVNTFLSKSIKKTLHKPYKAIMYRQESVNIG